MRPRNAERSITIIGEPSSAPGQAGTVAILIDGAPLGGRAVPRRHEDLGRWSKMIG
jgi:hypothetical protein